MFGKRHERITVGIINTKLARSIPTSERKVVRKLEQILSEIGLIRLRDGAGGLLPTNKLLKNHHYFIDLSPSNQFSRNRPPWSGQALPTMPVTRLHPYRSCPHLDSLRKPIDPTKKVSSMKFDFLSNRQYSSNAGSQVWVSGIGWHSRALCQTATHQSLPP